MQESQRRVLGRLCARQEGVRSGFSAEARVSSGRGFSSDSGPEHFAKRTRIEGFRLFFLLPLFQALFFDLAESVEGAVEGALVGGLVAHQRQFYGVDRIVVFQLAMEHVVVIVVVFALDEENVAGQAAMKGVLLIGLFRNESLLDSENTRVGCGRFCKLLILLSRFDVNVKLPQWRSRTPAAQRQLDTD
jgi:hypothetical protein